jgi:dTMP kinase
MKRGLFVTLEGGEAVGKTTLLHHLVAYLESKGVSSIVTREPGGTPFGEELRKILLLNKETAGIAPRTELLLFLASRSEHVEKVIAPNLQKGVFVLCDRFTDSSIAYQGYGRNENTEEVIQLCFSAIPLIPDLTFFLDLPPSEAFKRKKGSLDRLEREALYFHERVQQGYVALAERFPERIARLDASLDEEKLALQAVEILTKYLRKREGLNAP